MQDLASRSRGLPHTYPSLSHSLRVTTVSRCGTASKRVEERAPGLTQGTQSYTRERFDSAGLVPHMATATGSWAKPPRGKDRDLV